MAASFGNHCGLTIWLTHRPSVTIETSFDKPNSVFRAHFRGNVLCEQRDFPFIDKRIHKIHQSEVRISLVTPSYKTEDLTFQNGYALGFIEISGNVIGKSFDDEDGEALQRLLISAFITLSEKNALYYIRFAEKHLARRDDVLFNMVLAGDNLIPDRKSMATPACLVVPEDQKYFIVSIGISVMPRNTEDD